MEKTFDKTAFLTFFIIILGILIIAAVGLNVSAGKQDKAAGLSSVLPSYGNTISGAGVEAVLGQGSAVPLESVLSPFSQGVESTIEEASQANEETNEEAGKGLDVSFNIAVEDEWGYVNLALAKVEDHLNIRSMPSAEGKMVGKMSNKAACDILGVTDDGWAHVVSGSVEGYVSTDYLIMGDAAKALAEQVVSEVATVNTTTLKVRGEPNTESMVITMIPIGESLDVEEVKDGWVKFDLDDEYAYVSADYVDIKRSLKTAVSMKELFHGSAGVSNTRVDLCKLAQKSVGRPYVWGGTSLTKGADCSGFVMTVFKQFGVSLPHSAAAQSAYGTKIKMSEIKPGDLIFYAKGGRVNHVAIYIGGNQVVHASSAKTGIKVSNATYREPYAVRRLLAN